MLMIDISEPWYKVMISETLWFHFDFPVIVFTPVFLQRESAQQYKTSLQKLESQVNIQFSEDFLFFFNELLERSGHWFIGRSFNKTSWINLEFFKLYVLNTYDEISQKWRLSDWKIHPPVIIYSGRKCTIGVLQDKTCFCKIEMWLRKKFHIFGNARQKLRAIFEVLWYQRIS
jgi:hypothetical protein